jgi:hypothetical protein
VCSVSTNGTPGLNVWQLTSLQLTSICIINTTVTFINSSFCFFVLLRLLQLSQQVQLMTHHHHHHQQQQQQQLSLPQSLHTA